MSKYLGDIAAEIATVLGIVVGNTDKVTRCKLSETQVLITTLLVLTTIAARATSPLMLLIELIDLGDSV